MPMSGFEQDVRLAPLQACAPWLAAWHIQAHGMNFVAAHGRVARRLDHFLQTHESLNNLLRLDGLSDSDRVTLDAADVSAIVRALEDERLRADKRIADAWRAKMMNPANIGESKKTS